MGSAPVQEASHQAVVGAWWGRRGGGGHGGGAGAHRYEFRGPSGDINDSDDKQSAGHGGGQRQRHRPGHHDHRRPDLPGLDSDFSIMGRSRTAEQVRSQQPDSPINIPASAWTPEQQTVMRDAGNLLRSMATQTVPLAQSTPYRVMRELYEQFIAYARAYSDSLNNYLPQLDVKLGRAAADAMNALISTFNAVNDGAATARSVLVAAPGPPAHVPPLQDSANPQRFITASDKVTCGEWTSVNQRYDDNPTVTAWVNIDKKIPADQWTPEQKATSDAVAPVVLGLVDDIERTAQRSNDPAIQDFAAFTAQYERASAKALPTYQYRGGRLGKVGAYTRTMITDACGAVGA